ncbi:MAG: class II aldolase [Clostridia bacterium]|jgi:ribulose-5-phosphate 4-epimerase/fuculose-1-phosphate aldolase|nr:class II aldolase [Clostridia bacterium]
MYEIEKKEMVRISNYCGDRVDYVQGGGGNTSVKFDDKLMAIKASGYTLKEATQDKGYVTVNYRNIKKYYNEVDPGADTDFEKESLLLNMDSIVLLDGMENKRPSVEVGLHSFLNRCVIHTHSVYANMLCCAAEGQNIAKEIFADSDISYVFVPYIDPGFRLTLVIKNAAEQYAAEHGSIPDAIFMINHGVITSNDDSEKAIELHELVNDKIAEHFKLGAYPTLSISKTADGFRSETPYLKQFVKKFGGKDYLGNLKLYPDQLIYIGKRLGDAIKIDEQTGQVQYIASEKEANVIEETLMGAAFVINEITEAGLTLLQMNEDDASFINNWESEAYRSKLAK